MPLGDALRRCGIVSGKAGQIVRWGFIVEGTEKMSWWTGVGPVAQETNFLNS